MKQLKMPSFGADMAQGRLTEWLVKEGDEITRGDVIAIVETDKGAIELDVFDTGTVRQLLVGVDQQVAVGTPIALIETQTDGAEQANEETVPPVVSEPKPEPTPVSSPAVAAPRSLPSAENFVLASPAARRLAAEQGILLENLIGSGHQGAITLADVESALSQKDSAVTQGSVSERRKGLDIEAMREAIAATVTRSKREIPHYYLSHTLDVTALQQHLLKHNSGLEPDRRMVLVAPLLCAIARTLARHRQLNGLFIDGEYQAAEHVQLANAVNLRGGGLVMPVFTEAETLNADAMMARLNDLVARAKSGNLRFSELNGATMTVSSIGDRGADAIFGVIYPPQVAIIGLGRMREEPKLVDGNLSVRSVITASLAADHRVSDGHHGARFLHDLNKCLQKPEALWSEKT